MEVTGNVVLALAMMTGLWMTLVSLHLSDRSVADARPALLAERAQYPSQVPAARQIRIMAAAPALEETEGWMGFRSSIDGFNVNQNPTTGPGGAQDHQDPVAYYAGKWPSGTGATMSKPNNVLGAGGSAYQAPGRDSHWWSSAGSNSKGADSHSGNWQRAVVGRFALASPFVQLAGENAHCCIALPLLSSSRSRARWLQNGLPALQE